MSDTQIRVRAVEQSIKVIVHPNEVKITTRVEQHAIKVKLSANYVHPAVHPASMIVQDDTHQFLTATEKELLIKSGTYTHDQQISSAIWVIKHNLNKHPAVSIVDSSGRLVQGDVQYINSNVLELKFKAKFAGTAYLN